jgi:hypothetical protein
MAARVSQHIDHSIAHMFALQAYAASNNTAQRDTLASLGFHVTTMMTEHPELLPDAQFDLTWVRWAWSDGD